MGKCCLLASSFIFDRIISKVAGNQDRHKSSDEFDFWPDQTTHFGVTCPWMTKILHFRTWISLDQILCLASLGVGKGCIMFWGRLDQNSGVNGNRKPLLTYNGENAVSLLARLFLIESSAKLLVTRTGIKARTSLISGPIRLLTFELLALECRKFYTFELEYLWGQLANLDQILCVASLGVGKGCSMFWGRLDQNSGVNGNRKPLLTYNGENGVSTFSWLLLIRSFLYLQVTRTSIKFRTSLNFGQIGPLTAELAAREYLWSQLANLDLRI